MCEPVTLTAIAVGASIGAATSAATGGDPLMGALMGGATGAFFPGGVGVTGSVTTAGFNSATSSVVTGFGSTIALGGVAQAAGVGLLSGKLLNPILNPKTPDYSGYTPASQYAQQFNSQPSTVTGSGGRQASASLAEAIQRSKQRKLTQEDVGDLSIDTSAFASTGLQLA